MRGTANRAQVTHSQPNRDTRLVNNHQVVGIIHILDGHQITGLIGNLHCAHTLTATLRDAVLVELATLPKSVFAHHQQLLRWIRHAHHAHHAVAGHLFEADAAHAGCRTTHRPRLALIETDGPARARRQNHFGVGCQKLHVQDAVALVDGDGIDARRTGTRIRFERRFLYRTLLGAEHQVRIFEIVRVFQATHIHHGTHLVFARNLDKVLNGQTFSRLPSFRDLINFQPENTPQLREEQQVLVRGGHEQVLRKVVLLRDGPTRAGPAPALGPVLVEIGALDVAFARDGDDHRLVGNHVLGREIAALVVDFGAAAVAVPLPDIFQLGFDDAALQYVRIEHRFQVVDKLHQLVVLGHNLVALQAGEALQAHIENGAGLNFAELEALDELATSHLRVARAANKLYNLVQMVEGNEQAFEYVGTLLGFSQLVPGAPNDDFGAVLHKVMNELLQVQRHRAALHQAHIINTKRTLQLRVLVKVVEHHAGHGVALEVVHNAHAVAVRLVAHVRNALDFLVVNQRGGFLNHRRLVHHIGNFGDDDLLLAGF